MGRMNSTGIVFDIQRGALLDGPGLRTAIFLKGCPLRCKWCHNPESWSRQPQSAAALHAGDAPVIFGREMTTEEVMEIVRKDRAYYQVSGGGLTISGGEPTVQFEFCHELLKRAHSEGIHTCLDTCGYNQTKVFLELLPYVSLFLWDYKATGAELHKRLTGVGDELIRRNFEALYERGAHILLRCPMVPGVNDTSEHLDAIAEIVRTHPTLAGIEIMPYHDIGLSKYDRLGIPRPECLPVVPTQEDKEQWRSAFLERGAEVVIA